jgi:hypothetical protein
LYANYETISSVLSSSCYFIIFLKIIIGKNEMILNIRELRSITCRGPFVELCQYATAFYFSYHIIIVPVLSTIENILFYIGA